MTKRIFSAIVGVSALVVALGMALVVGVLYGHFSGQLEKELEKEARYLAVAVENGGAEVLEALTGQQERITLIQEDGTVLYDNRASVGSMENHKDRKEFQDALKYGSGKDSRQSDTLSEQTVYYALRLKDNTVLRVSSTQYSVLSILYGLLQPIACVIVVLLVVAGLVASKASKKIVEPINRMDLDHPETTEAYDEVAPLLTKILHQKRTIREQLLEAKRRQEQFALITENMEEGLLVIDSKTELLSCNSSALRLLGGKRLPDPQSVLALNRSEPFRKAVETVLQGNHEILSIPLGGKVCRLIVNPVFREKEVTGAVLLLLDITEKTCREDLRREFTANVSHELKTPLTSISGFAEILRDGLVKTQDVERIGDRIFTEAQRLITLVNDVIKISQLDEGCIPYEKETVNLYRMGQEILERLQSEAEKADVTLHLEGGQAELVSVPSILEEILFNLCDNAVKYNRPGGSVTLSVKETEKGTEVLVTDTGIGIPASQRDRIFERFYRVDKSHSKEIGGTGLGLSIVKHGAAYLGAEISLESVEGSGSTFRLFWPDTAE